MQRFARLCDDLDSAPGAGAQREMLRTYFAAVEQEDAALAASLLAGARPMRRIPRAVLRDAAMRAAGVPRWLFDASQRAVGDFAETIALLMPPPQRVIDRGLSWWVRERLLPLSQLSDDALAARLLDDWDALAEDARLVYTKLAAGTFRVRVSPAAVKEAYPELRGVEMPAPVPAALPPAPTGTLRVSAVLLYAERATPKGFELGTYTFGVWDERDGARRLTPIAKIATAPTSDRAAIDAVVRKTTQERFGPVRGVAPTLVCELAFDAVERSARHKAGLALRAPRFVRRLPDASVDDAATLDALYALLE